MGTFAYKPQEDEVVLEVDTGVESEFDIGNDTLRV